MLVELSARVGPSLDWWLCRPFAFALYCYRHLQEIDRRTDWLEKVRRLDFAKLIAIGFHEPSQLDTERRAIIAEAAGPVRPDEIDRARKMAAEIEAFDVLRD